MSAKRILVVEDDDQLRRFYRTALLFAGFEVEAVSDGWRALQAIEQHAPDLVVLDLMLPTLSGLLVQQDLSGHARTRHIPIVIVTGTREDIEHLDVACVLRKPVSAVRLVDTVRKCLASDDGAPIVRK